MASCRPLFFIVLSVVFLSLIGKWCSLAAGRGNCGPNYCDDKHDSCVVRHCAANQIAKTYPPYCRCCLECYTVKGLGEQCGEEIYAVCGPNLQCVLTDPPKRICKKI
uniref:Uncharacterized protein LOC114330566 isoform X2 n=1 Tax=Diabrotica virgifera virgifera TaxID=50390 RepID=A0A6P7FLB3_DIAVI